MFCIDGSDDRQRLLLAQCLVKILLRCECDCAVFLIAESDCISSATGTTSALFRPMSNMVDLV